MVNLRDFLATLLNDIAEARTRADIETIRLAETYSSQKLLKNLTVPRMRLKNIQFNLPIAINEIDEGRFEVARKSLKSTDVNKKATSIITNVLESKKTPINRNEFSSLKRSFTKKIFDTEKSKPSDMNDSKLLADIVADEVKEKLLTTKSARERKMTEPEINRISDEIRRSLRIELTLSKIPPPNVDVLINTAQLKEIGPTERLAYLNLTIEEDGLEWSTSISETGNIKEDLVPE